MDNKVDPRKYLGSFYTDSLVHDRGALRLLTSVVGEVSFNASRSGWVILQLIFLEIAKEKRRRKQEEDIFTQWNKLMGSCHGDNAFTIWIYWNGRFNPGNHALSTLVPWGWFLLLSLFRMGLQAKTASIWSLVFRWLNFQIQVHAWRNQIVFPLGKLQTEKKSVIRKASVSMSERQLIIMGWQKYFSCL